MSDNGINSILFQKPKNISDNCKLMFIDFSESENIKDILDNYICVISRGKHSQDTISMVKKDIKKYLLDKDPEKRIGAVAEFFAHLYFLNEGYTQECQLLNLEELSAKKGFDGYYTYLDEDWILESKSRNYSDNVNHKTTLKIAYDSLSKKLQGKEKSKNNPWRNAYNHAMHGDVGSSKSIQDKLRKLAYEYTEGIYFDTSNFNIIPCSTIFYQDLDCEKFIVDDTFAEKVLDEITIIHSKMNYKKLLLLAISNKLFKCFMNYIEEE